MAELAANGLGKVPIKIPAKKIRVLPERTKNRQMGLRSRPLAGNRHVSKFNAKSCRHIETPVKEVGLPGPLGVSG